MKNVPLRPYFSNIGAAKVKNDTPPSSNVKSTCISICSRQ